jgi:hypothetical protein
MEKKYIVIVIILAVLFGFWWIPVYDGKNVYQYLWDKIKEWLKHD